MLSKIAGRFGNLIDRMPQGLPETLATSALGAGLSVTGNVLNDMVRPGQEKDPTRIITEAVGAAGLGALTGAGIRGLRTGIEAPLNSIKAVGNTIDVAGRSIPFNPDPLIRLNKQGTAALGAGAVTIAGGMGGMIGGGFANLAGIPQTMPIDPDPVIEQYAMASQQMYS